MSIRPRRLPSSLVLVLGVALGWGLSASRTPLVRAGGADRSGESIVTTGPVMVRYDEGLKVPLPQDALYYLDYQGGRLLATVPTYKQTTGSSKLVDTFAERDLVADFKIDLENGPKPRFLMTTGSLGPYSDGWAPLFVFESTTNRLAIYRVQQQTVGTNSRPRFDLMELRSIARPPMPAASR
jgi:hypothetical protein